MFSSSCLVKLIVFEKQKTEKTNKNSTNTEELSTEAAICSAILDHSTDSSIPTYTLCELSFIRFEDHLIKFL